MDILDNTEMKLLCQCRLCFRQHERICGKVLAIARSFNAWVIEREKSAESGRLPPIRLMSKEGLVQSACDKGPAVFQRQYCATPGAGSSKDAKPEYIAPEEAFPGATLAFASHIKLSPECGLVLDDGCFSESTESFFERLEQVCEFPLSPVISHQDVVDDIRARHTVAAAASRLNTGVLSCPQAPLTKDERSALAEADQDSLDALLAEDDEDSEGDDSANDEDSDSEPYCDPDDAPAYDVCTEDAFDSAWVPDLQAILDSEEFDEPFSCSSEFDSSLFFGQDGFRDPFEGCEFKGYFQHKLFQFENPQSNNDFANEYVPVPVLKQLNDPQHTDRYDLITLSAKEARVGMCALPVVVARVLKSRIYSECCQELVKRRQEALVMEEEQKKRKKQEQIQEKLAREQKLREEEEKKEAERLALIAKQEKEREARLALLEQKEKELKLKKQAIKERKRQKELEKQQIREERRRRAAEKKAKSLEQQANASSQSSLVDPSQLPIQVEHKSGENKDSQSIKASSPQPSQNESHVFAPTTPEYSQLFDAILQLAQQEHIPEQCESIQDQRISMDILQAQTTGLNGFAILLPPEYIVSQCPAMSINEEPSDKEKTCTTLPQEIPRSPPSEKVSSESTTPIASKEDIEDVNTRNNSEPEQSHDEMSNDAFVQKFDEKQIDTSGKELGETKIQNEEIPEIEQFDPQYLAFFDVLPIRIFNAHDSHPLPLPSYDS